MWLSLTIHKLSSYIPALYHIEHYLNFSEQQKPAPKKPTSIYQGTWNRIFWKGKAMKQKILFLLSQTL